MCSLSLSSLSYISLFPSPTHSDYPKSLFFHLQGLIGSVGEILAEETLPKTNSRLLLELILKLSKKF
mgnify:CR=1 FL=1